MKDLMLLRFACKHFDVTKKIDSALLHEVLDITRLSPSSYGLQAWKFIVITNQELKEKLAPAAYNQPQITESAALVVFCGRTDISGDQGVIARYVAKAKADLQMSEEQVKGFTGMLTGDLPNRPPEALKAWTQHQVYLAAMTLMLAAAEKGIDTAPMEGFDPGKFAEILGLPEYMHPAVIVAMGYRNMTQPPKTRFDFDDVVEMRA